MNGLTRSKERVLTPWKQWAVLLLIGACSAPIARAQPTAAAPPVGSLQGVLDRIHQHAGDDAWRNKGFEDAQIEGWLGKLAGSIASAVKMPELKVPVHLAEVQPADPVITGTVSQRLLVGKNLDLKDVRLQNSIVLADGHAEFDRAEGCVIVARGAVRVQHSEYSVIVSGLYIEVSMYDGRPNDAANGSIIATRGWAKLPSAYGSIIAAHEGATVELPRDAYFVNVAIASSGSPAGGGARPLKVPDLPLEPLAPNPLARQLKALGIVRPDTAPITPVSAAIRRRGVGVAAPVDMGVVIRYDGRRYVAAVDQPILDESGKVVEPLRDWRLALRTGTLAIFSSSRDDVAVQLPGNR